MGDKTGIEWTDATWNPVVGCSIVSPGCTNCYAMKFAGNRLDGNPKSPHYAGTTQKSKAGPVWSGKVALAPEHILTAPLRWKKPRRIFVNSMGDLFHEDCPDEWIDRVFAVMSLCPQHTFQVLTKRAARMLAHFDDPYHRAEAIGSALGDMLDGDWIWGDGKRFRPQIEGMISLAHGVTPDDQGFAAEDFLPLPNVWLGVSAEDQKRADERIPHLLATPAAVRFVSAEPLLGPIEFRDWWLQAPKECENCDADGLGGRSLRYCPRGACPHDEGVGRLSWVIVGGESGPGARAMHPDWARSLRDQCAAAGVPYFFKQWGEWGPYDRSRVDGAILATPYSLDEPLQRFGKSRAGRLLDGAEHNGYPGAPS